MSIDEATSRTRRTRWGLPFDGQLLLAGSLVTTLGNAMHTFTVGFVLYERTGSAAAFGVVIVVEQALTFLMQLVAGPWVDRGDPRRTALAVEVLRGLLVCAAAIAFGAGGSPLVLILVMTMVIKVAQPFYRASIFSLAPAVMERHALGRFNAYSNISLQVGQLAGVVLAAPLYYGIGAAGAFFSNGLSFLLSGLTVYLVGHVTTRAEQQGPALHPVRQVVVAWHEVGVLLRREAALFWLLMMNTVDAVAVHLFNLLVVPLVALRFGGSAYWLSAIEVVYAVGAIVTGLIVTGLAARRGARFAVLVGVVGQAACFLLLAPWDARWAVLSLCFGLGAFNTISWTVLMTSLQLRVPAELRGRLGVARNLLTALITAAVIPVAARVAEVDLRLALVLSGVLCAVFAVLGLLMSRSRAYGPTLFAGPDDE